MKVEKRITSSQNPLVKQLRSLKEKSRERKKTDRFVIEGAREIELAVAGGYEIETLIVCSEILASENHKLSQTSCETVQIAPEIYEKLAHRGSTEGVLAIAKTKSHGLDAIGSLPKNPLILVAEAPEKPGNIGALLRTADAAKLDAVIIANPKSDLYNPNIIRSSVGCVFTNSIGMGTTEEIIQYLKVNSINIYCAALSASKNYLEVPMISASAIVVGTEATGLSNQWLENATQNIIIPMQGHIDSMNVSVSAAILIFEAKRQRGY